MASPQTIAPKPLVEEIKPVCFAKAATPISGKLPAPVAVLERCNQGNCDE
jgi:hypothetical protein